MTPLLGDKPAETVAGSSVGSNYSDEEEAVSRHSKLSSDGQITSSLKRHSLNKPDNKRAKPFAVALAVTAALGKFETHRFADVT